MNTNLVMTTIKQLKLEIDKSKILKEIKAKFKIELDKLYVKYELVKVSDDLKNQYNKLNSKGIELIKELKSSKHKEKLQTSVEVYIRYLKASLYDFEGKTNYLRKYITSFLFSSILFLALSPQFYGFILPILFFVPIYLGLKGVKKRSISVFI